MNLDKHKVFVNSVKDLDDIKFFTENKLVNYSYLFDRKIMKGKAIMIDIAYLPDSKICNTFSSELALIFRDSYGNLYEQPFFLQQKNRESWSNSNIHGAKSTKNDSTPLS